jgi:hypothetical protein
MPGTYQIAQLRPILGRHVHHDPRSRRFSYTRGAADSYRPPAVSHQRHIPIFDQSYRELGSCTADAGLGLLGTGPYWAALTAVGGGTEPTGAGTYPFTEDGVIALYENITANDPFEGAYPPEDTGSDGLSMAQALQRARIIPGYQHTFTLGDALRALANFPLGMGTVWTDNMFYPSASGLVRYRGESPVGGHEWIADEYVPGRDWVGGTTSWGTGFGVGGRFYLTTTDFGRLLAADGDVIVLTPPDAPPPVPLPEPGGGGTDDADRVLADAFDTWRAAKGVI